MWKREMERRDIDLILISALILLLELTLIRWISTEIRIFAYVNNLVLLACFLGIGLGCYYARRPARPVLTLVALLAIMLLVDSQMFRTSPVMLSVFSDSLIWFAHQPYRLPAQILAGITATVTLFAATAAAFVPLGQVLGSLFTRYRNTVLAYSINIVASLIGVWLFAGLSFAYAPPWVWLLLPALGVLYFVTWTKRTIAVVVALGAGLLLMATYPLAARQVVVWSPYQKLQVTPLRWPTRPIEGEYHVAVNGVNYMVLLDLSDDALPKLSGPPTPADRQFSHYDIPYVFKPGAKDVLIVGAGGGNDVAGALRNGAERVVAVEIDPGIYSVGLKLHPEAPYANPKARVVINDARSFFKTARDQFDVIAFGLLDSHTLGSALTNTRIDHYVYTLESFREARALLKPDGVLTVAFETPRPWVRERLRGMLQ